MQNDDSASRRARRPHAPRAIALRRFVPLVALLGCMVLDERASARREATIARMRADAARVPEGASPVPLRTLVRDQYAVVSSNPRSELRELVRDSAVWRVVWQRVGGDSATPAPAVDFAREQVVVVQDTLRSSAGDERHVAAAYTRADSLVVVLWRQRPGASCTVGETVSRPRHVVVLPRTSQRVYWREVAGAAPPC